MRYCRVFLNNPVFWAYLLVFSLLLPALAVPWALLASDRENRLSATTRWGVGKLRLEIELMGALPYRDGPQALAGNMLHLDAWHGYQEVVHRPEVNPRELRFRLRLGKDGYLVFFFGRSSPYFHDGEAYHAVRLSLNPDKPSCWLDISSEGEFLHREPLSVPGLRPEQWQEFRLLFGEEDLSLWTGGGEAGRRALAARGPQFVGFRGGARPSAVDDVVIVQADGLPTIRDGFSNRRAFPEKMPALTGRAALLLAGLGALFAALLRKPRTAAAATLSAAVTVLLCSWVIWHHQQLVMAARYPLEDARARAAEAEIVKDNAHLLHRTIEMENSRPLNPGEKRIVFLGASQTWGVGASLRGDTFVNRLETLLNHDRAPNQRVLTLNGAVPGSISLFLNKHYRDFLATFEHSWLVVSLGVNERDPDIFRDNLRNIVESARGMGVRPLFCIEALSMETHPNGPDSKAIVVEVAREMGIPLFDLHEAVQNAQDDGLFWWDVVHPTSYGHRRIAEALLPLLKPFLGTEAGPPPGGDARIPDGDGPNEKEN